MIEYCNIFSIRPQAHHKALGRLRFIRDFEKNVIEKINKIRAVQPKVGARKLKKMLFNNYSLFVGRDTLLSIMYRNGLHIKRRRLGCKTTDSRHTYEVYPNKIKNLDVNHAEQVFVSDITYIRVAEKFMYLFLVTDIYSKKIMGYHLGDTLHRAHSLKAMRKALKSRQYPEQRLHHHSDCGGQYCSNDYVKLLNKNNIEISMTEKDHCYENSIAERVNGILKGELIPEVFSNPKAAKKLIREAIRIYNEERLHLSCNMLTPIQAHKKGEGLKKLWSKRTWIRKTEETL